MIFSKHSLYLSAAIAIGLLFSAGVAHSASRLGLPSAGNPSRAESSRRPEISLPTPTGEGVPFRQFVFATCPSSLCKHTFALVPSGKLLDVRSISCVANVDATHGTKHWILTTSPDLADLHTAAKAIIGPTQIIDQGSGNFVSFGDSSGPYFFKAGERPYLLGAGGEGGGCGLFGYLYPVN